MIQLKINGKAAQFDGDPEMPLLWYLRDEMQFTGTKYGCGLGLMRRLHRSRERRGGAQLPDADEEPSRARPSPPSKASRRTAIIRCRKPGQAVNVPQCGYCQSGQIMQAAALLKKTPKPTRSATSTPRCRATSAAAALTSASARPSSRRRG